MPNAVKYSTTNQTGSIRSNNVAIGNNNIEYGPTAITNWYNGITPPSGKYVIYETLVSGSPRIYVPNDDVQLITLAKSKGSTTNTAAGAIQFFASQSGFSIANENYPNIVTSESALLLDASYVESYPTTGSIWYDISGNGKNGSLINGPTFNNAGYITFDGVDDATTFPIRTFNTGSPQQGTFNIRIKFPTLNTGSQTVLFYDGGNSNNLIYLYRNANFATNQYSWLIYSTGSTGDGFYLRGTTYLPGRWYDTTFTFNNTGTGSIYRNGELIDSSVTVGGGNFISWKRTGNNNPSLNPASSAGIGSAQLFQWYNRPLTQQEILQNYYGGPIVTNGLVFAVDAGNFVSYESGSTTTYSLTGSLSGSLVNGTGYNSVNGGTWNFDGVDDYIIITGSSILQPASTITLEAVFQRDGGRTIINYGPDTGGATKVYSFEQTTNASLFQAKVTTTSGQTILAGPILATGTWYHVVMTYNGSTAALYINGLLYTSSLTSGSITYPANSNLNLGRKNTTDGEYISGKIAFNRIYNRALSATEVLQNFRAQSNRFI